MSNRREFITLLGGAAATWPLAARAQQPARLPTIGFLGSGTISAWSPWTAAFVQRLRELGWIEGRNVAIEYRWAEGRPERYAEIAAEFVQLKVDVIVTTGAAALAAKQTTSVIPIVFAVANDPIGSGLVAGGRLQGAQEQRGCTLCLYGAGCIYQRDSHQHPGSGRPSTDDARPTRIRRSGRPDILWHECSGHVPARCRVRRQDFARGEAERSAGRAGDEVRTSHQPDHCTGARSPGAADTARPRRRGDRMIERREFITLLGGAAAAWPLAARAQQGNHMRRISLLQGLAALKK